LFAVFDIFCQQNVKWFRNMFRKLNR